MSEITEQCSAAEKTDDSCRLEFIQIVPLTKHTDGPRPTEYDNGDWSAEVKQENCPDDTGSTDILHITYYIQYTMQRLQITFLLHMALYKFLKILYCIVLYITGQ